MDALVALYQSDLQRSLELSERSKNTLEQLVAEEPGNVSLLASLSGACSMMYKPLMQTDKIPEAVEAISESIRINQELLKRTPDDNTLFMFLAEAFRQKGNAEVYMFEWEAAISSYHQAVKHAVTSNKAFGKIPHPLGTQEISKRHIEALNFLLGKKDAAYADLGPVSKFIALLLVLRKDSDTSSIDQLNEESLKVLSRLGTDREVKTFEELFKEIGSIEGFPESARFFQFHFFAKSCALRARNLADDPSQKERCNELIDDSIKYAKQVVALNPAERVTLIDNDVDFIWLSQTPQYKASGLVSTANK